MCSSDLNKIGKWNSIKHYLDRTHIKGDFLKGLVPSLTGNQKRCVVHLSSVVCCVFNGLKKWFISPTNTLHQYSDGICQEKGIHSKFSISLFSSKKHKFLIFVSQCNISNVYLTWDRKWEFTHWLELNPNQQMWRV